MKIFTHLLAVSLLIALTGITRADDEKDDDAKGPKAKPGVAGKPNQAKGAGANKAKMGPGGPKQNGGLPPGIAKKQGGFLPPGLAKKAADGEPLPPPFANGKFMPPGLAK